MAPRSLPPLVRYVVLIGDGWGGIGRCAEAHWRQTARQFARGRTCAAFCPALLAATERRGRLTHPLAMACTHPPTSTHTHTHTHTGADVPQHPLR